MVRATLSAQAPGPHKGDVGTHIFSITTYPETNVFTPDGNTAAPTNGNPVPVPA